MSETIKRELADIKAEIKIIDIRKKNIDIEIKNLKAKKQELEKTKKQQFTEINDDTNKRDLIQQKYCKIQKQMQKNSKVIKWLETQIPNELTKIEATIKTLQEEVSNIKQINAEIVNKITTLNQIIRTIGQKIYLNQQVIIVNDQNLNQKLDLSKLTIDLEATKLEVKTLFFKLSSNEVEIANKELEMNIAMLSSNWKFGMQKLQKKLKMHN